MRRRDFLLASAAPFLGACEMSNGKPIALPAGDLLGPDLALGHRLRSRDFPAATQQRKVGIAIVGGGIAGLSAAWQLTKRGITDWQIFELDEAVGGNARSGSNAVSPFPWGAGTMFSDSCFSLRSFPAKLPPNTFLPASN